MYNSTSMKFLLVLVVFQFALQESLGANFYSTEAIKSSHYGFNSGIVFSQKLADIAKEFGCICDHNGAQDQAVEDYCQSKNYWGTSENLLWNDDWQEAGTLNQWINEGPGGGHYENMKSGKEFGCYLAGACNPSCGYAYTVRCEYCRLAGWQG